MSTPACLRLLVCMFAIALGGKASAQSTITVDGDLKVTGNLVVTGDLTVNGTIQSRSTAKVQDGEDIFVKLWRIDQQNQGMTVTLPTPTGGWQVPQADIRLNEQNKARRNDSDQAPLPLLVVHDATKLNRPTYNRLKALFDNYKPHQNWAEDDLGTNTEEDREIDEFLNAILATEVMQECHDYINAQKLAPNSNGMIDEADLKELIKHQWFTLYTNYFGAAQQSCSGFEHVFVGEYDQNTIKGHHFWWKFYLDQQVDLADSLGHNYGGPAGEKYPWVATFKMKWKPEPGVVLTKPDQKGFFVGCSPELTIAYGTLGLLWEKKHNGNHPIVELDNGRFELVVHASTLDGAGDPNGRRGDHIKSVFPRLIDLTGNGTGTESISVADALAKEEGSPVQVKGVIVSEHNGEFGLRLADSLAGTESLAVKLPSRHRGMFNPIRNPNILGRTVVIEGKRGRYTGIAGITGVRSITVTD